MQEKLQKLLNERQIPFLLPNNNNMEFRKILGTGTFGRVDLVRYQKKLYAHKRPLVNHPDICNNILNEAIKLTDIPEYHPNIQQLYFINLESFGFLMDYYDCGPLDKFVADKTSTYTLVDALNWGYQLADALSFLHSNNISKFIFLSFLKYEKSFHSTSRC
jgi:serine/threonine protein kinase